jgi:predicted MFS family arabinose efflux permease
MLSVTSSQRGKEDPLSLSLLSSKEERFMVPGILLLVGMGIVVYVAILVDARLSRRTRAYLLPMLIELTAVLLIAFFFLLGGIHIFEIVGAFVIGICATLLIVVLEVRKARKAKQQQQHQEQRTMPPR